MHTRRILFAMRQFSRRAPVCIQTHFFDKRQWDSKDKLQVRIAKELGSFLFLSARLFPQLRQHRPVLRQRPKPLASALNIVSNVLLDVETKREVKPSQYRLFQLADYVCTMELVVKKDRHQICAWHSTELGCFRESSLYRKRLIAQSLRPEVSDRNPARLLLGVAG